MTMKLEYKNGPYGLDRITADDGTVFYLNSNGVFDTYGKKVMKIISTDCTEEQKREDMPELFVLHKRAMETELMWQFFGGVITLDNGNKYQVAEFE